MKLATYNMLPSIPQPLIGVEHYDMFIILNHKKELMLSNYRDITKTNGGPVRILMPYIHNRGKGFVSHISGVDSIKTYVGSVLTESVGRDSSFGGSYCNNVYRIDLPEDFDMSKLEGREVIWTKAPEKEEGLDQSIHCSVIAVETYKAILAEEESQG